MARWYCPKCHEINNGFHNQHPATGKLHCGHCGTVLVDFDKIDRAIARYDVQGC